MESASTLKMFFPISSPIIAQSEIKEKHIKLFYNERYASCV